MARKTWTYDDDGQILLKYGSPTFAVLWVMCSIARGTEGRLNVNRTRMRDLVEQSGLTPPTVTKCLQNLEESGRLKVHRKRGSASIYELIVTKEISHSENQVTNDISQVTKEISHSLHILNKDSNKRERVVKPSQKNPDEKEEQGHTLKGPLKPTLEQVQKFFKLHGFPAIQADTFFYHHEEKGWVTSQGQIIMDWTASARKWNARNIQYLQDKLPERNGHSPPDRPDESQYIVVPPRKEPRK